MVVEGLLIRSYRYMFVYLYIILNPREEEVTYKGVIGLCKHRGTDTKLPPPNPLTPRSWIFMVGDNKQKTATNRF